MKLDGVLAFVAIMSAGLASAKTVAWWRFEGTPGATAPTEIANSVADSTIPALTAASIKTLKFGSDADFMPKFVAPSPKALKVYDPVSKSCVANASSLRLRDSREANPLKNGCAYTDAGKLPLKGDFTIECFFRIPDAEEVSNLAFAPILTIQAAGYVDTSIQINKGKLYCRAFPKDASGAKMAAIVKTRMASLGDKWHHVAMTYSAAGHRFSWFLDYKLLDSKSPDGMSGIFAPEGTKFLIGANGLVGGRNYPGEVDEVRVSDEELKPTEFLHFTE